MPGINIWDISCKIAIKWMPQILSDYRSTLIGLAFQATNHYMSDYLIGASTDCYIFFSGEDITVLLVVVHYSLF